MTDPRLERCARELCAQEIKLLGPGAAGLTPDDPVEPPPLHEQTGPIIDCRPRWTRYTSRAAALLAAIDAGGAPGAKLSADEQLRSALVAAVTVGRYEGTGADRPPPWPQDAALVIVKNAGGPSLFDRAVKEACEPLDRYDHDWGDPVALMRDVLVAALKVLREPDADWAAAHPQKIISLTEWQNGIDVLLKQAEAGR